MIEARADYKKSTAGYIPQDWQDSIIGECVNFSGGTQPPRTTFTFSPSTENIRLVQIRDYKSNDFATYIPKALARKFCSEDDIMIGRYGPPIFQILRGIEGAYNVALIKATNLQSIDREYLYYVLTQPSLFNLIDSLSRRTSGQTGVEMPALRAFPLPLPPLPEQQAIAKALGDVDGLIAALEALIAKKRDIKQGAMQQLLSGHRRLPGFNGEWKPKNLGSVGTFAKGSGVRKDEASSGDIPCIRYGELYTHHSDIVRTFNSHISEAVSKTAFPLKRGDILFAGSGETKEEIGKCAALLSSDQAFAGGDIVVLRPHNADSAFLGYLLNSPVVQRQKASKGQGDAVVHISATALSAVQLLLPEPDEQTAIGKILLDMDAEIAALEAKLAKTCYLKQGMMQVLLTGEVRLL
jgi:type I restriction enzyme, S subunit